MARGNPSRVAATLAAIAQGDAPPPELEVIRTPRTGTPLTHRLMVLFSGNPVVNPGWLATNSSPRALAEPMLNAWASKLLGNGTKIRCTIERLDDTTGAVVETRTLPLSEVAVGALDMVYSVEASTSATQPDGALSDVEQQVLYYAKHKTGGFDPQATIRLQLARPANLAAGETTLFDALEQARSVRRLLSSVRGADPEDLNPPERTGGGTIDVAELETRVVRAENALNAANNALKALVAPTATTTTAEALRTGLMKMGAYGIGPYVPIVAAGESPAAIATLSMQAKALLKTSGARLEQVAALRLVPAATNNAARRDPAHRAHAQRVRPEFRRAAALHLRCRRRRRAYRRPGGEQADPGRRSIGGARLVCPVCPRARPDGPHERVPARRRGAGDGRAAEPERRATAAGQR